jgi:hypothetical protein
MDHETVLGKDRLFQFLVACVAEELGGLVYWTYRELHALGSGSPQLSTDNDFAPFGTTLHDESQDTVAGSSNGQAIQQFVA